jgi:membrane associated rhomboid family serine protease
MSYYQNNNFLSTIAPVTKNLLIINFIVWVGCWLTQNPYTPSSVALWFGLQSFGTGGFSPYQLVTYMFTHEEFSHIFFNMFALFMFGTVIERHWGPKRYLIYYLVTGIGAGLVQLFVWYIMGVQLGITIGASGAVFGLLLAFGMLFPNTPLFLMFIPIPIKAKYMVIGYGLIEFFFGFSNYAGDNVAHFAHLGGMLFGIILILYWRKKGNHYYNSQTSFWKKITKLFKKNPKKMRINYRRPETDWEYNSRKQTENKEIDRILEKIKYSGYNSLTDDEKKKLFDASRK